MHVCISSDNLLSFPYPPTVFTSLLRLFTKMNLYFPLYVYEWSTCTKNQGQLFPACLTTSEGIRYNTTFHLAGSNGNEQRDIHAPHR